MAVHTWRCRKVTKGVPCGTLCLRVKQRCTTCGAPRPKRKQPAHAAVLRDMPYEEWVAKYGERCGICGKPPKPGKRLDRDHDHTTGRDRGLLCGMPCNKFLMPFMTSDWLRKAADYLDRAAHRAFLAEQQTADERRKEAS